MNKVFVSYFYLLEVLIESYGEYSEGSYFKISKFWIPLDTWRV